MRIGDLAKAVGVSTRTVRHYHQVGVLPEPDRTLSGYRDYSFDDLVRLMQVRHLVDLGLGLSEIATAVSSGPDGDLSALLDDLDADLAEQERALARRRAQLRALRSHWEGSIDLGDLGNRTIADFRRGARAVGAHGPTFELDHQIMSLLPDETTEAWVKPITEVLDDPEQAARIVELYARFDALEGGFGDRDIDELLQLTREALPPLFLDQLRGTSPRDLVPPPVLEAVLERLTPPQRAVADALLTALMKKD
ncbi:hypothetical protein N802_05780 [Knoellia sinensis KCTC 19936]|uniref:HTH merR-type domain-containing protein n=1 Tax=Knoellia sinensis KCTC 19936 TaxID=1385520 RepID=A0A0A0J5L4_9MICO|nr:MerR family transcriptional regulator [Knoellia sinensis]KGN30906.1 hypothetical protein N802_05780 [Knoellia sinensis KCTC 19936]